MRPSTYFRDRILTQHKAALDCIKWTWIKECQKC